MAERQHEYEKTHHECKCRDCNPITAMAERMDAWKSADSLLDRQWGNDQETVIVTPQDVVLLATWLLYGPAEDN